MCRSMCWNFFWGSEEVIQQGVENVKQILANNYARPDEAQKILSLLRQHGSHTIIDMVSVELNIHKDVYEESFTNMGLTGIPIDEEYPAKYDRLLGGGIWCIVQLAYVSEEDGEDEGYHLFGDTGRKKGRRNFLRSSFVLSRRCRCRISILRS